jgi:putative ABC transport system permease protein
VNTQTQMQAAAPAFEITKLLNSLGLGLDVLRGFALAIVLVAALGAYLALAQGVRERHADLAMLRLLGAPPARLAGVVLAQSALMALAGLALGVLLAHGMVAAAAWGMAQASAQAQFALSPWVLEPTVAWAALAVGAAALAAALWPAWTAYRVDVAELLQG